MLVVDDNAGIRQLVEMIFTDKGYEVETATNGSEAIAKVMERCPDVILLDYRMPGLDGFQTWEAIQKIHPNIPAIMMTGYGENEIQQTVKQSIKHFVTKPFSIEDIYQLVNRILTERIA
ncbi:response regulator [Peptococcaceae bacterium 1198_IL3148]